MREEGADLRQHHSRRRDQPRAGQGAGRAARGDAGEAGDDRRHDVQARGAVPRAGDAEPDRAGGDVSASRSAGRPLHAQAARRLSDARRGEGDHAPHGGRRRDRRAGTSRRREAILEARHRIAELYMDDRIMDYIVDIVHATREPGRGGAQGPGAADRVRREPARDDRARAGVARARVPARPRVRDARRREGDRARRAPSPRAHDVRGGGGRGDERRDRARVLAIESRRARRRSVAPAERRDAAGRGRVRAARDPPAGQAARAAHARARELAVHRRVPLGVQGAGDGVRRGARVPAGRRGALASTGTSRRACGGRTSSATSRSASSR